MDDNLSIRVPYKNNTGAEEVEMMKFEQEANRRIQSDNSNLFPDTSNSNSISSSSPSHCSFITLILSCTVAAGVQFGWALQLSLLTPYIQVYSFKFVICVGHVVRY